MAIITTVDDALEILQETVDQYGEYFENDQAEIAIGFLAEEVVALQKRLSQFQWRPIKSAPKDGSSIMAAWPTIADAPVKCFFSKADNGWCCVGGTDADDDDPGPTHWMPVPIIPQLQAKKVCVL